MAGKTPPKRKPPGRQAKQAVVIIHGMGQQRPMQTLRSLVHVLWETDLDLTANSPDSVRRPEPAESSAQMGPPQPINKSWLVPDTRTGSKELVRVTTPAADSGMRTDFYELYWADIMEGTTREHLVAWVTGLLWRWPHQVPRDVVLAWILLWVTTIAGIAFALSGLSSIAHGNEKMWLPAGLAPYWPWFVLGLGALAAVYYWRKLEFGGTGPIKPWDRLFAVGMPLVMAGVVAWLLPYSVVATRSFASLAASAAIAWFIQSFLVPYFGDVARYVRAQPDTVAKRAAVMDRGLALLRNLHGHVPPADKSFLFDYDHTAKPERTYQRVIVVAHSLGSVIAYDLLRHFWAERGPVAGGVLDEAGRKALLAMEAYVKDHAPDGKMRDTFDVATFRDLQRDVSRAIAKPAGGWLISDFVTMGSPLTHGEFLLARDRSELERAKQEGLVATCPPLPDPTDKSILYKPPGPNGKPVARHSALFSAVRWSNIHDQHKLVLTGDIVSGPVTENFGDGIADHNVRIVKKRGLFGRVFTHLSYWSDVATSRLLGSTLPPEQDEPGSQVHIDLLRGAVALDDETPWPVKPKTRQA